MTTRAYATPYCLHCYAALKDLSPPSTHCPRCGKINLAVDLKRLWTKERRILEIEHLLKALVVMLIGGISIFALLNSGVGISPHGHGMAAGAPILVGLLLWDVASITQKTSVFRGSLIWSLVCGITLLPAMAFFVNTSAPTVRLVSGLVSTVCLTGLLSPLLLRRYWMAWRMARISGGQRE